MKSASFDYIRPETLDAACACLASHPDARIIAGGQSLVPMLAMRLARPSMVIDIAHIDGLSNIQETTDTVVIGAMVRQAAALSNPMIARHLPLLAKALKHVGHPQAAVFRNHDASGSESEPHHPTWHPAQFQSMDAP